MPLLRQTNLISKGQKKGPSTSQTQNQLYEASLSLSQLYADIRPGPGGLDCHEEIFLDQHYFRQNDTSSTSSPADPASSPLSPPPFTSPQFQSQSLRVLDYPILSNVPHSGNGQNWETLQRQVLYPQGESGFLGPSTTAVGYMQDTSVPNCHATMDNYSTRGIAAMQTTSPSVNISSVPRNSATLTTNLPTHSPTPYASSLDSSSDFQNFVPAPDWFSLATSANGAWNQYSQQ